MTIGRMKFCRMISNRMRNSSNDTLLNDNFQDKIQLTDIQRNDTLQNGIQQNDIQENVTEQNDIQQNGIHSTKCHLIGGYF